MKNTFQKAFEAYLFEECGSSGRGTVSTYCRALDVLSIALGNAGILDSSVSSVWDIESVERLMDLHKLALEEQKKYNESGSGIFSSLNSGGRSYFKNRWCSAALQKLAAFRQENAYAESVDRVLYLGKNGIEISKSASATKLANVETFLPEGLSPSSRTGKEILSLVKQRVNQSVFRKWILAIYGGKCCMTGVDVPEVLRASHIVEWSKDVGNRMNPCNGLCLSATFDAAFDKHLLSFDEKYRMVLSKRLSDFCTRKACRDCFKRFEGVSMSLPSKFLPDPKLLEVHRNQLVS